MSVGKRVGGEMGRHALADRGNDLYETPPAATRALLRHETALAHSRVIWEPACGPGAMARELEHAGHRVIASDLVDYRERRHPGCAVGVDFLLETRAPEGVELIVTNPPFKLADAFARQGLLLVPRVIFLLRLGFLEGVGRSDLIDRHLTRVWLGRERLQGMHRDGWDKPQLAGKAPFA